MFAELKWLNTNPHIAHGLQYSIYVWPCYNIMQAPSSHHAKSQHCKFSQYRTR